MSILFGFVIQVHFVGFICVGVFIQVLFYFNAFILKSLSQSVVVGYGSFARTTKRRHFKKFNAIWDILRQFQGPSLRMSLEEQ